MCAPPPMRAVFSAKTESRPGSNLNWNQRVVRQARDDSRCSTRIASADDALQPKESDLKVVGTVNRGLEGLGECPPGSCTAAVAVDRRE
jgi:hypothetical protein